MVTILKDIAYKGIVKKDAEELAKRIGDKDSILAYLGSDNPEEMKIPNRKGAYERLYEALIAELQDDDAMKLAVKKDLFVLKRKVSVLWEDFMDKTEEKKKLENELKLKQEKEKIINRLYKINTLQEKLHLKQDELTEQLQHIKAELGEEVAETETAASIEPNQELIEKPTNVLTEDQAKIELEKQPVKIINESANQEMEPQITKPISEQNHQEIKEEIKEEVQAATHYTGHEEGMEFPSDVLTPEEIEAHFNEVQEILYGNNAGSQPENQNSDATDLIGQNF